LDDGLDRLKLDQIAVVHSVSFPVLRNQVFFRKIWFLYYSSTTMETPGLRQVR
jgi:hypothetical protein